MITMRKLIACLVAAVLLPACATAQRSDSVQARNTCRLALQIVETGHPEPHTDWAYERVAACGSEAGAAVATALRRYRQNRDTVVLDLVSGPARTLRDGRIFEAALEISLDRRASAQARVFAFRTLIHAVAPGIVVGYRELSEPSGSGRGCFGLGQHLHHETITGAPLPPNYVTLIRNAATSVAAEPEDAAPVRRAATCTLLHLRAQRLDS